MDFTYDKKVKTIDNWSRLIILGVRFTSIPEGLKTQKNYISYLLFFFYFIF